MMFRIGIAIGLFLVGLSSASANLISNGDFSTGNFSGWTNFTTATGTTSANGGPNIVSFDVTGTGSSLAAHFGVGGTVPFDTSQQGGGIFQSFTSGAGAISISANIAAFLIPNPFGNGEAGVFHLLLDSVVVNTLAFGNISQGTAKRGSLAFSGAVGAGSHELRIEITRPFGAPGELSQYVDNVNVVQLSAVPEPASIALLGLGLAGLGFKRRKTGVVKS